MTAKYTQAEEAQKFLEDELCAAVREVVDMSAYAIVMRRTGWDGGEILTLEELGNNPAASRRTSPVSRERIRQIESRAFATIEDKRPSMPTLERTVAVIEENAPLAVTLLSDLLKRHQLTRHDLGLGTICAAMKTFQVNWNLDCRTIGQELFLLPRDQADAIEVVWGLLVEEAQRADFVQVEKISPLKLGTERLLSDLVELGVTTVPTLDWLDQDRQIYWNRDRADRGWNKIINVCRKILTVAPTVPLERLAVAIRRARTTIDLPSIDALARMLGAVGDIDLQDGRVARGSEFRSATLSNADRLMINAARNADTVTTFYNLREALVRQRLSAGHAQLLIATSPLWVPISRGKYRFISNEAQLKQLHLNEGASAEEDRENAECLVELEIRHRHLVIGTHRIDKEVVTPGRWFLRDEMGNDLGIIDVTANTIKGLDSAFKIAGIGVGRFVIIEFSDDQFTATAYY